MHEIPVPKTPHFRSFRSCFLTHLAYQAIDCVLPVAQVSALHIMFKLPGAESTVGVVEFEWPQEVGGLLEVWTDSVNYSWISM